MTDHYEILVSASDAEVLAPLLAARAPAEAEGAAALADLLTEARLVPHEYLPSERIAMNSRVTYLDESHGEERAVTLVHPNEADAGAGRISVLSPVGRALLGRSAGAVVAASAPDGRTLRLRIVACRKLPAREHILPRRKDSP